MQVAVPQQKALKTRLHLGVQRLLGRQVSEQRIAEICDALALDTTRLTTLNQGIDLEDALTGFCATHCSTRASATLNQALVTDVVAGRKLLLEPLSLLVANLCEQTGQQVITTTFVLKGLRGFLHPETSNHETVMAAYQRYQNVAQLTEVIMLQSLEETNLKRQCVMFLGMGRFDVTLNQTQLDQFSKAVERISEHWGIAVKIMPSTPFAVGPGLGHAMIEDPTTKAYKADKKQERAAFKASGQKAHDLPAAPARWIKVDPPQIARRDTPLDANSAWGRLDLVGCSQFLRDGIESVINLQSRGALLNVFFKYKIPEICQAQSEPAVILFSNTDDLIITGRPKSVEDTLIAVTSAARSLFGISTRAASVSVVPGKPAQTSRNAAKLLNTRVSAL